MAVGVFFLFQCSLYLGDFFNDGYGGVSGCFFSIFFSFGFPLDIIFRFSSSGGNVVLEYYETWGARAVSFSRFDSWFKVIGSWSIYV